MGGNLISYPQNVSTCMAHLVMVKCHINSMISTLGAWYMFLDFHNSYLGALLDGYEYMQIHKDLIPPEIIQEYVIDHLFNYMGHVHIKIQNRMYGLLQVGMLAKELGALATCLHWHGYTQTPHMLGLWNQHMFNQLHPLCRWF